MGDMSSSNLAPISGPEPVAGMIARPVSPGPDQSGAQTPRGQAADLRLVIEEDASTGAFVYKTLDRRTGEVVQQLPRDAVLKLQSDGGYTPGQVVDTRE
jgi:flagellar protein FlaG